MAQNPKVSYKRAPSEELLKLLKPEGDLSWLIDLGKNKVAGHQHDVHFRGNEIHVYRDGARLIRTTWTVEGNKNKVKIEADPRYEKRGDGFFGIHSTVYTTGKKFQEACKLYLCKVELAPHQKGKEGAIQMKWGRATEPWVRFDREVTLENNPRMKFCEVDAAFEDLMEIYRANCGKSGIVRWSKPSMSGNKIDQLAIDTQGRLVLLELKDALAKPPYKVYYAPFQLLQYVWEWHSFFGEVRCDLQELITARKRLQLTPDEFPHLSNSVRAAVGFGCDIPSTEKEGEGGYKYKKVLEIVNQHLPREIDHIETWYWSEDGPRCLSW